MANEIPLIELYRARQRIRGLVRQTPLEHSPSLSALLGAPVYLKLESQQITGSFKLRGASNAIAQLDDARKARGVVAASTGNHGRALAHAARVLGVPATICLSQLVPANKVEAIRALGAEVRIVGNSQDDAQAEAERISREQGAALLPPFDHPQIIAGQGTLGLEILEQLPQVRQVLVPLSGGGLFGGVAVALKAADPSIRLHGISMRRGAAMAHVQRAGRVGRDEFHAHSLADAGAAAIGIGFGKDALQFGVIRAGGQEEVDETRTGNLHLRHQVVRRQRRHQLFGQLARFGARGFG